MRRRRRRRLEEDEEEEIYSMLNITMSQYSGF